MSGLSGVSCVGMPRAARWSADVLHDDADSAHAT